MGTLGAAPGENGVYGTSEELDYDDVLLRWRYEWRPSVGFGNVSGHVLIEEESCAVNDDCVAGGGGTCTDGACVRPAAHVEVLFPELGAGQAREIRLRSELCADEVGLDFEMRCKLADDEHTVHIELRGTLF